MRRLLLVALVAVWCGSACDVIKPPDKIPTAGGLGGFGGFAGSTGTGGGGGGGTAQSMRPPDLAPLLVAVFGAGAKLLADVGNSRLEIDPTVKDPLTGLAACADSISYCYAPPSVSISQCFASVRKCTSATDPWNESTPCCPSACQTAYDAEVAGGMGHVQALEKVLFREPDCYPGARAALEGM